MEAAFQAGAGFSAIDLQLLVRGMIASLFVLWTVWALYSQFKLVRSGQLAVGQWVFNGVATFTVLTMVLVIVGS